MRKTVLLFLFFFFLFLVLGQIIRLSMTAEPTKTPIERNYPSSATTGYSQAEIEANQCLIRYQGPVKEGYDEELFRKTGIHQPL